MAFMMVSVYVPPRRLPMIVVIGTGTGSVNPENTFVSAYLSPWSSPETVAGFARSSPNDMLMRYAAHLRASGGMTVVDIGCGAGRNAIPLALQGWNVLGIDLSWPMLEAARARADRDCPSRRTCFAYA